MLGAPHSSPMRRLSSFEDLLDWRGTAAMQYWRISCSRYLSPVVGVLAKGNCGASGNGPE